MAARGTLPDVMLFYGERGCGKTSMARVVARALNCEAEAGKASETPCGKCPSCEAIARGISPDVIEIDAASNGSVDMVREVVRQASFGTAGSRKVYIIDEAHGVSSAGFDAMLKTLEELDGQVVFILCSTRPKSIPQTVRDRCRAGMFKFDALVPAVIRKRLEVICAAEGFAPEPGLLDAIAQAARGGMRDAIMRLEQVAAIGVTSLQMWRELTGETDFAPALIAAAADGDDPAWRAELDKALAAGDPGRAASELILTLADLLVLATPGGTTAHAGEALEVREKLAARLGSGKVLAVLTVMWELQAKVKTGDPRADLILACTQIRRRLCPPPPDQGPISTGASAAARLRQVLGEASERT
jgi:DNA polymerase-3 subunit gamma/tau